MRTLSTLFLAAVVASPLTAQGNPVSTAVQRMGRGHAKSLLAAAQALPADKYNFKPTPAQMSFGEIIAHIADDNGITCGAIGGKKLDGAKVTGTDTKEKLVAALDASLTFCNTALAGLTDAKLGDQVSWYGSNTTRAMAAVGLIDDWSDHYAMQAMYLRLNGVLPPTAQQGGM
ncbi:MAG TPA: DinB family protein [Gemmatimonadales bacterium]|jgi:uncharacterized damage-inducible protein DinB|nr:DinB family protein [Gemmatimonadales bacterium]